jgi:hypothetical protein
MTSKIHIPSSIFTKAAWSRLTRSLKLKTRNRVLVKGKTKCIWSVAEALIEWPPQSYRRSYLPIMPATDPLKPVPEAIWLSLLRVTTLPFQASMRDFRTPCSESTK